MDTSRTTAVLAGIFFIVAAAAAIVGLALYQPLLDDPAYVLDASRGDTQVLLGALFEVLTAVAVIGTATTLYPVLRRQSEGLAISYVVGRLLEAALIVVGIISLLSVVTLRQDAAAAGDGALVAASEALVALHDWTFLFGPGLAIGINTLLLATLMYRSRLVPRAIAVIGLAGGPIVFASSTAVLFGAYEQTSAYAMLAAFPVFAWEMALAVWMIAKGLDASPGVARAARDARPRVAVA